MARALENPDRNFSADGDPEDSFESLRYALANSEPALPFNEAAKTRIGKLISDAVLPSRVRTPVRRLAVKHRWPPAGLVIVQVRDVPHDPGRAPTSTLLAPPAPDDPARHGECRYGDRPGRIGSNQRYGVGHECPTGTYYRYLGLLHSLKRRDEVPGLLNWEVVLF